MEIGLKEFKKINWKRALLTPVGFWFRHSQALFLIILFFVFIALAFLLYRDLNFDFWNEYQRKDYAESIKKEVVFNEKNFQEVISKAKEREIKYTKERSSVREIFNPISF